MSDSASEFVTLWTQAQPEVRRYISMLVIRPADSEDVLQQTAARLWEKFEEYDHERPFLPWAIRFAYMEVLSWRQKYARSRLVFSDETLSLISSSIVEESPLLEIRRQALDKCLQELSEKERSLLLKRYAEHGGVKQAAEDSRVNVNKLYYTIEKLRIRLLKCVDLRIKKEGWNNG